MKQKRLYLRYLEKSLEAIRSAISSFNNVYDKYKIESTLILLVNAWELLGKAILIRDKISILKNEHGNTISSKDIIIKLNSKGLLDENQTQHLKQVVSLRNEAVHAILPNIPIEILHHLFYFCCKFYKDIIIKEFPRYADLIATNFLSIAFSDLTTYADKVQKLVGKLRRGRQDEKKIIWLLERGIRFDGTVYISQEKFEKEFKAKRRRKILPHLHLGKFLKSADMVRIIPVQAPKNYTADISLRKGKQSDSALPVFIKKTNIEDDYPHLTSELGMKLNKSGNFIAFTIKKIKLKGDSQYHQEIRSSKSSKVNRYSESALNFFKKYLEDNPNFNPYKS